MKVQTTSSNLGERDGGHSSCEGGRVEHMQGGQADLIFVIIMLMMVMIERMVTMVVIERGINEVKAYRVPDKDKSTSVPSVARGALPRGHC